MNIGNNLKINIINSLGNVNVIIHNNIYNKTTIGDSISKTIYNSQITSIIRNNIRL